MILLLSCIGADDNQAPEGPLPGLAVFGHEAHDLGEVTFDVVVDSSDGLAVPRDLAFNPEVPGELWIPNRDDDSMTIVFDAGTADQSSTNIVDPYAVHFMPAASSIAFGKPEHFGTCQESRNTYGGTSRPNDFMGPTLWSSDLEIFGQSNPEAVEYLTKQWGFYADLGSHLDMLHESPNCMGIAWDVDNVYWVFDGKNAAIVRYDFVDDHGPGYDDHSDGIISRYVEGEVSRVEEVPSHLELDRETGLLYIADTGNNRVAVLDTLTGTEGGKIKVAEPGTDHHSMDDAERWTLVEGGALGMGRPSGLALHEGVLYVGDHATGNLFALDAETGEMIDWLPTGLTGLMGLEVVSAEEIWMVDADTDAVYRLTP